MELLVVMTIIVILAGMLLPALQQARGKAKHARWMGIRQSHRIDPYCALYYTFEKDTIDLTNNKGKNLASCTSNKYYKPRRFQGDLQNGVTLEVDGGRFPGKSALRFDESNHQVYINDLGIDTSDFSINAWIKTTGDGNFGGMIFNKGNAGIGYRFGVNSNGLFYLLGAGSGVSYCDDTMSDGTSVANDDNWHMVTCVFDRNSHVEGFIDGQSVEKITQSNNAYHRYIYEHAGSDVDQNDAAGCDEYCGIGHRTYYFSGYMCEIAVYKRVLTNEEIKQIYRSSKP